ncbi:MAG: hypothetical protein IT431_13865 [Phycisphaerales bacterium]|nr:hypothetical protein [Phycisphaerales bacterium]
MPSPTDPITAWRRRQRTAGATAVVVLAASALWSWWPLPALPTADPALRPPADDAGTIDGPAPLDRAAFAASIWNPPPAPERTAEQAPTASTPPPLRLQLIGIARDAGPGGDQVLRAALYDPDTDRLHILAEGERVGAVTVIAVEPGVVRLESGGRTAELRLRRDEERAS